jgi:predicted patatin/cPLA2 family phospholipase
MTSSSPDLRRPLGVALAGGGAHGAWQIGALSELERSGVKFDSVLGFSAGALNGAAYTLGRCPEAIERWRTTSRGVLRFSPRLFPSPSLFSNGPLWERVDYAHDDKSARASARCNLTVISAQADRTGPIYARFEPDGRWDAPMAWHLLASSAIPLVFPRISLTYEGKSLTLFDGGVPCEQPLDFSPLSSCADVLFLEMVRPDEVGRPVAGLLQEYDQKGRETVRMLMNQGAASLRGKSRVFRLHPSRRLDFTMLTFDAAKLDDAIALGASDARAFLARPESLLA